MIGERLTNAHERHPHTGLPDGFHGVPAGVCPWCSGPPDPKTGVRQGEEGCDPQWYVRHEGPCPVWQIELNEHGGIHRKTRIGPNFVRLGDL